MNLLHLKEVGALQVMEVEAIQAVEVAEVAVAMTEEVAVEALPLKKKNKMMNKAKIHLAFHQLLVLVQLK